MADIEATDRLRPNVTPDAPAHPVNLIAHAPRAWFLLEDADGYLFDANVSHGGVSVDWVMRLTPAEVADWRARGRAALDALARDLQDSGPPWRVGFPYAGRNLHPTHGRSVVATIAAAGAGWASRDGDSAMTTWCIATGRYGADTRSPTDGDLVRLVREVFDESLPGMTEEDYAEHGSMHMRLGSDDGPMYVLTIARRGKLTLEQWSGQDYENALAPAACIDADEPRSLQLARAMAGGDLPEVKRAFAL